MDGWNRIPWKKMQRNVFKLQQRIYQASRRGDIRTVHTLWKSITSFPKLKEGVRRETTCNCCIDIVTIGKQPERLVAKVRMTHATLLRSRMNGNVHVRFWSRVGVATPRLRQRL